MAAPPVAAVAADASIAAASAASSASTPHVIGGIPVYLDYTHHLQKVPATHPAPFMLRAWIDEHAKTGQQGFVYKDGCQFQLQLRAGPLTMPFYHVQGGEAWIYVISGAAQLRVISGRDVQQLSLPTGMCFLVPGQSPYSLQCISAETRVLLMTRQRKTQSSYPNWNKTHVSPQLANFNKNAVEPLDPLDQLLWMCGKCGAVAHQKSFECIDYNSQSEALDAEFAAAVAAGSITCAACSAPYTAESLSHAPSSYTTLPASAAAYPVVNPVTHMPPYHLLSWVDTHRHLLAPPVGNKMIHGSCAQFKVMIVGGPNERTDYHIDDGEEWFLMLEGDMTLKIVDGDVFRDVRIKEGESYLLPPNVPHSPQRGAGTIGLVIERDRFTYELDGLRWYCPNAACRQVLTTFSFKCGDLGTQLKTLIGHWYDTNEEAVKRRTCNKCGAVETKPNSLAQVKVFTH